MNMLADVLFKPVMRKGVTPGKMQYNACAMEAMAFESSCWVCVGGLFIQWMQRYNFRLCFGVCVVLCWTITQSDFISFLYVEGKWFTHNCRRITVNLCLNRTIQQFKSIHTNVDPWCSKNNQRGQIQNNRTSVVMETCGTRISSGEFLSFCYNVIAVLFGCFKVQTNLS